MNNNKKYSIIKKDSKLCKIKIQRSLGSISPKFNIDYWQEVCLKSFYDKSTIKTQLYFAWNIIVKCALQQCQMHVRFCDEVASVVILFL
jgi:ABC-type transport system involved in multi-copper enzyme maturation permease subunit